MGFPESQTKYAIDGTSSQPGLSGKNSCTGWNCRCRWQHRQISRYYIVIVFDFSQEFLQEVSSHNVVFHSLVTRRAMIKNGEYSKRASGGDY